MCRRCLAEEGARVWNYLATGGIQWAGRARRRGCWNRRVHRGCGRHRRVRGRRLRFLDPATRNLEHHQCQASQPEAEKPSHYLSTKSRRGIGHLRSPGSAFESIAVEAGATKRHLRKRAPAQPKMVTVSPPSLTPAKRKIGLGVLGPPLKKSSGGWRAASQSDQPWQRIAGGRSVRDVNLGEERVGRWLRARHQVTRRVSCRTWKGRTTLPYCLGTTTPPLTFGGMHRACRRDGLRAGGGYVLFRC